MSLILRPLLTLFAQAAGTETETTQTAETETPEAIETGRKTVRVGWYETPFNITDRFGRHSGYAYEYQQKIAAGSMNTRREVDRSCAKCPSTAKLT